MFSEITENLNAHEREKMRFAQNILDFWLYMCGQLENRENCSFTAFGFTMLYSQKKVSLLKPLNDYCLILKAVCSSFISSGINRKVVNKISKHTLI